MTDRSLPAPLVTALAAAGDDLDALCRAAAGAFAPELSATVHLWVRNVAEDELRLAACVVPDDARHATPIGSVSIGPALLALAAGSHPQLVRADDGTGPAGELARGTSWAELLLVPLTVNRRATGVIAVGRPFGTRAFAAADVELAAVLGRTMAMPVDHARLVTGAARYARHQHALARIGELALTCPPLDHLFAAAVQQIAYALDLDLANVSVLDPDGTTATVRAAATDAAPVPGERFVLGERARLRGATADTAVYVMHADQPDWPTSTASQTAMSTTVSVMLTPFEMRPIFLGGGSAARRAFTPRDLRFVESVAHLLTAAVDNRNRQENLERIARTDALTGLWNREHLVERLGAAGRATPAALLLADLDEFKVINDSIGHAEGDQLLCTVAARLAGVVRPGDLVARLGGDEFAVLCAGLDERSAVAVAERAVASLSEPVLLAGRWVRPGVSIGVALDDGVRIAGGSGGGRLLVEADLAMYRAKASGGRRVVVYDALLHEAVQRRLALQQGLRRAIEQDELHLVYQPIVSLADGALTSMEALVRWHDDDLGDVPASEIIAVAEESSLVCEIDTWVLRAAARQMLQWVETHPGAVERVSVNVSARNFDEPGFVARVRSTLATVGCPPSLVAAEITETHLLNDSASEVVRELRDLGMLVAIDDYGVGYSSVSHLTRLAFGMLKIDRTFVAGMLDDPAEEAVVRSTISLGHELGKVVVAEGVERLEQLEVLERLGCDAVQGYLLSRPVDGAAAAALLAAGRLMSLRP